MNTDPRTTATVAATAGALMSHPVITVAPDTPLPDVASTLRSNQISAVPVLDTDGTVVGLVSEYDLLAREGATAAAVMTRGVVSVDTNTDVSHVRHLLVDRRIRRVPVLERGRLVGIVSRGDVVALLATEWVCEVCGESVRGDHRPETCPKCHGDGSRFVLQEQPPGA